MAKLLRDGGPVDLLAFISAQSAGTNVVLYREYKLRPELVETGNACALPYTVTRICLLPQHLIGPFDGLMFTGKWRLKGSRWPAGT